MWEQFKYKFLEDAKFRYASIAGGVLTILLVSVVIPQLFLNRSVTNFQTGWEQQQRATKEKQQQEYQALLDRQANSKRPTSVPNADNIPKAIGKHTVHIVLVKPPNVSNAEINPLINTLKDNKSTIVNKNLSLAYMNSYIQKEAEKYIDKEVTFDIKTHGPYTLQNLEKVGDFANFWGKDFFSTVKLRDSFEEIIKQEKISIKEGELVVFLYFDDSFEAGQDADPNSFYEYKKFRSFANPETGRAYVNVYSFTPSFSSTVVEVVMHETLHLFGATDKYEEYSEDRICSKRGRGVINNIVFIPQTTGDIMCLYIEYEENEFKRGKLVEENLVINEETAQEIGWIK